MKKTLFLTKFIVLLLSFVSYAQNLQNNNWIYGNDVSALNFNSTPPTGFAFPNIPAPNYSIYLEGNATLSDQNGNLLLFSDGERLWQKQGANTILITGALKGHYSSTQNVIFIPKPGNPNRFFVVTINGETSDYLGLYYSEVDVTTSTLISTVNRTLFTGTYFDQELNQFSNRAINESYENQSQSITSYPHSNGKDYWLVAHVQNNNGGGVLLSYKVTCNGISGGMPERAKILNLPSGIAHTLKISPDGSKIALNTQYSLHYGSFNNTTGVININNHLDSSNSTFTAGYGLEFSPNSNVLFYSEGSGITARNLTTNSTTVIPMDYDSEVGIQLARDGKIYIADDFIKIINNPNDINNLQLSSTSFNCGLNQGFPQWVYWQPSISSSITAQNDIFNFNSCVTSTSSQSVLQSNPTLPDTFNGNPITSLTAYTLSVVGVATPTPSSGGISLNPNNGLVTVLSGTPTGTYKIKYRICEVNSCPACSNDAEVTINVTYSKSTTPTFSIVNPLTICSGNTVPVLPSTSIEGISGTWSPSIISNTTTADYIFTPSLGLCASTAIITVNITSRTIPTFNFSTSLCSGQQAPVLPNISTNGISGSWNPATINNTSTGSYTFTPSSRGCTSPTTIIVTVTPKITPTFTINTTFCSGDSAPLLPTTSNNGISGSWSPSIISNISSGNYIFTPNINYCANQTTITITVNECIDFPVIGCINFDPTNSASNIYENYAYVNFGPNSVSNSVSFEWYFKFDNGQLIVLPGQNPTFDVHCPENPVRSFGLIVSNGISSVRYYSGPATGPYHIQGFTGQFRTCFIHDDCSIISKTVQKVSNKTNYKGIRVFPNPTNSTLKFQGENLENYNVSIFDITGKEVIKNNKIENDINVEKLEAGFYIYRISNNNGFIQEGKIIKN